MVRTKKSGKAPAKKRIGKFGVPLKYVAEIKNKNALTASFAVQLAEELLATHVAKSNSGRGYLLKGEIVSLSKDAPEEAQKAGEFLLLADLLDAATEGGDVETIRELAIHFGFSVLDLLGANITGKRTPDVLSNYRHRIDGSRKGGSRETVWAAVEDQARPIFEKFKRGKGISNSDALRLTRGELIKLQRSGKLRGTVPGLTCLRDHLVKKPSSGK